MDIIFSEYPNGVSISNHTIIFATNRPFYHNDNFFNPGSYAISIYGGKIYFSGVLANKNAIRVENIYGIN